MIGICAPGWARTRATASQKTSHGATLRKLTWHFSRAIPCHLPRPTHRPALVDAPIVFPISERVEVALIQAGAKHSKPSDQRRHETFGHCVKHAPQPIDKSVGQWVVNG